MRAGETAGRYVTSTPPQVAIVGRPNVGKSTLFNRLVRRRLAIVHPEPGVTRDRLKALATWRGITFVAVDTGGLLGTGEGDGPGGGLPAAVLRQAMAAVREAALVVLVVDARDGPLPVDRELAQWLRRTGKPYLLVANKVDAAVHEPAVPAFSELGLGDAIAVSAASGRRMGDLLDRIVEALSQEPGAPGQPSAGPLPGERAAVRIAIVGRPNVGKSSLVNRILGEERVAVAPEAGTTQDAVDVELTWAGKRITLIDTAGMRRRAHSHASDVERLAVQRALGAMERADVAVLMIDATEGVTFQDARLAGRAAELGLAVVLAVNKWDLVPPSSAREPERRYARQVQTAAARLSWAPVHFISALHGSGVPALVEAALACADRRSTRFPEETVRAVIEQAAAAQPPASTTRHPVRILHARQVADRPPTFLLRLRGAERLEDRYLRYLENRLRQHLDLAGTPVRWVYQH